MSIDISKHIAATLAKIVLVIVLIAIFFIAGLAIGYGVIGGKNPMNVFRISLWKNILAEYFF